MPKIQELSPTVAYLSHGGCNVYFVGRPKEPWILIDSGAPGSASSIMAAAESRYGKGADPQAIYLTHGHIDHSGSARVLAEKWGVPIYAHPMEMPYITGRSKYPAFDPTVGGFFAFVSRVIPNAGANLAGLVEPLSADGALPGFPEWRWLTTPGHAPGNVSYHRTAHATVIAGDAVATVDMDSFFDMVTMRKSISRPASPVNYDWDAAEKSVKLLATLQPNILGCGHGVPRSSIEVPAQLDAFAANFPIPEYGRYVAEPAMVNLSGVVSLPPAPPDKVGAFLKAMLAVGAVAIILSFMSKKRSS